LAQVFSKPVTMGDDDALHQGLSKKVPHYQLPTTSQACMEYFNMEQDVIRQCFQTGNYNYMKEAIPVELGPDAVNALRRQRMERNRTADVQPTTWSKMTQLWGGGYYREFEYMPDEWDRAELAKAQERASHVSAREKISAREFYPSSVMAPSKFEPLFPTKEGLVDRRKREPFPYLPTGMHSVGQSREKYLGDQSILAGPFQSGSGQGLDNDSRQSRMMLPTIVARLQRRLEEDWDDTNVVVSATDQDLVQIAFHMAEVDSERGVMAYMNVLAKDNELLNEWGLRKVSQLWGAKRDFTQELQMEALLEGAASLDALAQGESGDDNAWMFFVLAPKWVRMRPTDALYTLNPRMTGSKFKLSAAGTSVMLSMGHEGAEAVATQSLPRGASKDSMPKSASQGSPKGATEPTPRKMKLDLIENAVTMMPHSSTR